MMDIQEAIKTLTVRMGRYHPSDKITEATEMAISALQEQAEREKGCEYCKGNALDDLVLTHDIAGSPRIALHGGNTPIDKDEKPVLCPHCGRYLGDKK